MLVSTLVSSEKRVYDLYIAGRQSAALAAAVRLGLFAALDGASLSASALASRLGRAERPIAQLCRVLVAMGLLVREGESLSLSVDAARCLVPGRPESLVGLIDLEVENFLSPSLVLDAVRCDGPAVYASQDPWRAHEQSAERARAFTRAMHDISSGPAAALARAVDFSAGGKLLDLGGGSGAVSIALARAWPALECVIVDLPAVCALADEYVAAAGLSGRIRTLSADFFRDPLPENCDALLLSQILHDWSPERGAELLRRARASLRPAGRVLVHEKLVSDDGHTPLANALVDLDMLVWTEGQQYTPRSLRALLESSGFEAVETRPTSGYWSLTSATRSR
jgi:ubiquinone/menaquinone biosynthesis C-methylase UbiE